MLFTYGVIPLGVVPCNNIAKGVGAVLRDLTHCAPAPGLFFLLFLLRHRWRSISVNQGHLLCYGLNFILELTRH
jgi:hypothetical protein